MGHGPDGDGPFCRPHIRGLEARGGGRRERLFEAGALKLLALHILDQQPAHGYEIIKAIADLAGGDYSPSPGTVYPTLNLLEDLGYATVEQQAGGRKQYRITPEGRAHLQEQAEPLARVLEHLQRTRQRSQAGGAPDLRRAMENLRTALQLRFGRADHDADLLRRAADLIDRAAVEIGRL